MLTRLVRLAIAFELAAAIALGAWLFFGLGWGAGASILAVVALALGVRVFLVAFTFTVTWIHRTPRGAAHRIGATATLRMLAGELGALLVGYYVRLPLPDRVLRPDPAPAAGGPVPVLLVHGYLANRGYFAPTVRWLEARGVAAIHVPNFTSILSDIETFAGELHHEVERVASAPPGGKVVLVCHSMGGLAARLYLRRHGTDRIARLVTMGSPHHGTAMAPFGIGPHAAQMRRGAEFLRSLAEHEGQHPPAIPAVSIYTTHDNMVAPQSTSRLDWATNVAVPGVGHIRMVSCEPVLERVLEELRAAGAVTAA